MDLSSSDDDGSISSATESGKRVTSARSGCLKPKGRSPSPIEESLSLPDAISSDSGESWSLVHQPLLDLPTPPKPKLPEQSSSTRALTSIENLERIQQKEREKQAKAQLVEERARKREEKKALVGQKKANGKH